MKKTFILVTAAILLLSACSTGNKESKVLTSETQLSETTTSTVETTAAVTTPREVKGDMTIRTGTKLDIAEFDKVGPLIDGNLFTYKNVGEPYLKASFFNDEDYCREESTYCEQEIGYLNCKTGEKVTLCKVKPILGPSISDTYIYSGSTYVYMRYTKKPDEIKESYIDDEYKKYSKIIDDSETTILQINLKTNEVKEYNIKLRNKCYDIKVIGKDVLLSSSIEYPNDYESEDYYENTYIDRIDLNSGKMTDFYYEEHSNTAFDDLPDGEEDVYLSQVVEDKAYFEYIKHSGNEWISGFRVYDKNMKLLNETEVNRSPERKDFDLGVDNTDVYIQYFFENGIIKYQYKNGEYVMGSYCGEKSAQLFTNGKYKNIPYDMCQDVNIARTSSTIVLDNYYLTGKSDKYSLKIDIDGFKCPQMEFYQDFFTDWNGNSVIYSGDEGKSGYGYYYITKEEIMKALNGE